MAKKKSRAPKLPKKRTPLQESHKEAKKRKQYGKQIRQQYDGSRMLEELEERSKNEDFSQAAARIVRQATERK